MISRRSFVNSLSRVGGAAALLPYSMPPASELGSLTDIITSSASRLATAIRRRQVSSVEVIDAFLRRIDQINPKLNAVVQLDRDGARAAARAADRVNRRERLGPSTESR